MTDKLSSDNDCCARAGLAGANEPFCTYSGAAANPIFSEAQSQPVVTSGSWKKGARRLEQLIATNLRGEVAESLVVIFFGQAQSQRAKCFGVIQGDGATVID